MKGVHGPGPKRGSMDQGSMFCPLPSNGVKRGISSRNVLEDRLRDGSKEHLSAK